MADAHWLNFSLELVNGGHSSAWAACSTETASSTIGQLVAIPASDLTASYATFGSLGVRPLHLSLYLPISISTTRPTSYATRTLHPYSRCAELVRAALSYFCIYV